MQVLKTADSDSDSEPILLTKDEDPLVTSSKLRGRGESQALSSARQKRRESREQKLAKSPLGPADGRTGSQSNVPDGTHGAGPNAAGALAKGPGKNDGKAAQLGGEGLTGTPRSQVAEKGPAQDKKTKLGIYLSGGTPDVFHEERGQGEGATSVQKKGFNGKDTESEKGAGELGFKTIGGDPFAEGDTEVNDRGVGETGKRMPKEAAMPVSETEMSEKVLEGDDVVVCAKPTVGAVKKGEAVTEAEGGEKVAPQDEQAADKEEKPEVGAAEQNRIIQEAAAMLDGAASNGEQQGQVAATDSEPGGSQKLVGTFQGGARGGQEGSLRLAVKAGKLSAGPELDGVQRKRFNSGKCAGGPGEALQGGDTPADGEGDALTAPRASAVTEGRSPSSTADKEKQCPKVETKGTNPANDGEREHEASRPQVGGELAEVEPLEAGKEEEALQESVSLAGGNEHGNGFSRAGGSKGDVAQQAHETSMALGERGPANRHLEKLDRVSSEILVVLATAQSLW